ncbi:MAG: hypothetical protein JRJ19_06600 [Deltaproteobacteria bacterium]|nr:hypothetical protein [Deltaproteobacteria bacterium]
MGNCAAMGQSETGTTESPIRQTWWARNRLHLAIFGVALCIFSATSADRLIKQSEGPHFVYLADAFLHGQVHNFVKAPNDNDWIRYEGKTYVSFPPVPAILMLPGVVVFGINFNDVIFTLLFAALNVLLMFLVLQMLVREKLSSMSVRQNLWLTALFGFGTVNFSCSILGEVWFTAQVIGVTFTLAYILCATRVRKPLLAGLFLALAFDTRVNLAFTVSYFALQLFFPRNENGSFAAGNVKAILKKSILFSIPILVVGALQMWMNHLRFHSLFEFGHSYLSGPAGNRIDQHGLFAFHYFEWNLRALLLRLPTLGNKFPWIGYNAYGLSIFLTTPIFIRLFWPRARPWIYSILWATAIPALLVPLFYQNSGYVQFGYRFALDITPYLVMLLSVGKLPMNRWTKTLIIIGILVNLAGAIAFKRIGPV